MIKRTPILGLMAVLIMANLFLYGVNQDQEQLYSHHTLNQKQLGLQLSKGSVTTPIQWRPKVSRIEAARHIDDLTKTKALREVTFKLSPEMALTSDLNLTRVEFQLKFDHDAALYTFIEDLGRLFAGMIFPTELTVWEAQNDQPLHALYKFDWVTLK